MLFVVQKAVQSFIRVFLLALTSPEKLRLVRSKRDLLKTMPGRWL
jgi:hypothetical protein